MVYARKLTYTTIVEMNRAEPMSALVGNRALPRTCGPFLSPLSLDFRLAYSAADKALNTSGAPLPNASSVTPARDSDSLNLSVICSRDGDKY